jgi:hypothetical protein
MYTLRALSGKKRFFRHVKKYRIGPNESFCAQTFFPGFDERLMAALSISNKSCHFIINPPQKPKNLVEQTTSLGCLNHTYLLT